MSEECPECGNKGPAENETDALYAEIERLRQDLNDARDQLESTTAQAQEELRAAEAVAEERRERAKRAERERDEARAGRDIQREASRKLMHELAAANERAEAAEARAERLGAALRALADDKALAAKTPDGCRWQIQVSDDVRAFARAALSPPPATPVEAPRGCCCPDGAPEPVCDYCRVPAQVIDLMEALREALKPVAAPPVPVEAGEGEHNGE